MARAHRAQERLPWPRPRRDRAARPAALAALGPPVRPATKPYGVIGAPG